MSDPSPPLAAPPEGSAPSDGWDRLARAIDRRPGRMLLAALLPLLVPLLLLPTMETSHDTVASLPDDADSVGGYEAIERHFGGAEGQPLVVVIDHQESLHTPENLTLLADLSRALTRVPGVTAVRSAALPTAGAPPEEAEEASAELEVLGAEVDELVSGLEEAAGGAGQLAGGTQQVGDALARIEQRLPQLQDGLERGTRGAGELVAGLEQARVGVGELRAGVAELRQGLADAGQGARRLRHEVTEPATEALTRAMEAFDGVSFGGLDPRVREGAEAAGEAFAALTGRFPPGHPREGEPVDPAYAGLSASLGELEDGIDAATAGSGELLAGLDELAAGLEQLRAGAQALRDGLVPASEGVAELRRGVGELRAGVTDQLVPGARELERELAEGAEEMATDADELADLDSGALAGGADEPFVVTAGLLRTEPELREALRFFTTDDETRTRLLISLDDDPFSGRALTTTREVERTTLTTLDESPLADADAMLTGAPASISEVDAAVDRDFPLIVVAVTLGVALVLAVLLRSVVVPVYMIATVLLTYGAALGAATGVFQHLLGGPGIEWWIPSMLFVLLVVLGVDYSIFLMSRVREEAGALDTRAAVAEGVRRTGRVITSCGVILAGTFAALLTAPLGSLRVLGFAAFVGILLDTFIVRAVLVPSIATLLGRHNWWPSSRARTA